ncbi:PAS domain-containing protein [Thiothrix subterranea]|uniref:PAS domain-containing protein n=1 Tax=Thiothrix subterranea TaxID=2735563 RepID=A0AA51MPV5_9GAMM|nr:PAS domain-containing protein [Thiothrix subterranea]MDQ5769918.1 PAS domain-containing protein [Thiothrix subterranea]QQZ27597.1 PAS domain-containing protein [Thiothrix subterranea]WML86056.1 PAS domain-containing protein [Thiothrix subterranea]
METVTNSAIRPALLQSLIDYAEHGITIAEREGNDTILLYVNRAFEQMTGYNAEDCLYQDCRFLQSDDRDQAELSRIRSAIESEQPVRVILRNYRKDGSLFWNDLSISPFFDEEEGVMYYIGVQKDVTELVALQTELADVKARLAALGG